MFMTTVITKVFYRVYSKLTLKFTHSSFMLTG